MEKKMRLLIGVRSMWGPVEWILPVCKYLKDSRRNNIDIVFILIRKNKKDIFVENQNLEELTWEISSGKCYDLFDISPAWVKFISRMINRLGKIFPVIPFKELEDFWFKAIWKLFGKVFIARWITKVRPNITLMDGYSNVLFDHLKKRGMKMGFFCAWPSFIFSPQAWLENDIRRMKFSNMGFDFYLTDTEEAFKFFKGCYQEDKVYKVGTPKYDTWWIEYLKGKTKYSLNSYLDEKRLRNSRFIFLKNDSSIVFRDIDWGAVLKEIIEVCSRDKEKEIIIRSHPRQNVHRLKEIISCYPEVKITICHEPSFALLSKVSSVISMPSSIIFDALIMGKPVIEYFPYGKLSKLLKRRFGEIPKNSFGGLGYLNSSGCLTSIFRGGGLVLPADTPQELEAALPMLKNGGINLKIKNIRDIFPDNASQWAAKALVTIAQNNDLPL